jgi:hypothetical protein
MTTSKEESPANSSQPREAEKLARCCSLYAIYKGLNDRQREAFTEVLRENIEKIAYGMKDIKHSFKAYMENNQLIIQFSRLRAGGKNHGWEIKLGETDGMIQYSFDKESDEGIQINGKNLIRFDHGLINDWENTNKPGQKYNEMVSDVLGDIGILTDASQFLSLKLEQLQSILNAKPTLQSSSQQSQPTTKEQDEYKKPATKAPVEEKVEPAPDPAPALAICYSLREAYIKSNSSERESLKQMILDHIKAHSEYQHKAINDYQCTEDASSHAITVSFVTNCNSRTTDKFTLVITENSVRIERLFTEKEYGRREKINGDFIEFKGNQLHDSSPGFFGKATPEQTLKNTLRKGGLLELADCFCKGKEKILQNIAKTTAQPESSSKVEVAKALSESHQSIFKSPQLSLFESMDKIEKLHPVYQLGKAIHDKDMGKMYELLRKHQASTFQLNEYPKSLHSPFHIAAEEGNSEALHLLVEYGFNVNHTYSTVSSRTALSYAVEKDKKQVAGSLITWGADPTLRDDFNKTPFEWGNYQASKSLHS